MYFNRSLCIHDPLISVQRPDVEVLKLLLMVQPLLGALGPQLARPRALDLDDLLGGGVLGKMALISAGNAERNLMFYTSFQY